MVAAVLYWIGQLFGAVGNACTRVAGWCAAWALKCDSTVHRVTPPELPAPNGPPAPPAWRDPYIRLRMDPVWRPGHENTMTARNLRLVKPARRS